MQNIKELPEIDQHLEMAHQEKTKVKNIQVRRFVTPAVDLRLRSTRQPVDVLKHRLI